MNFLLLNITGDDTGANKYAMIMQVAEDMIQSTSGEIMLIIMAYM